MSFILEEKKEKTTRYSIFDRLVNQDIYYLRTGALKLFIIILYSSIKFDEASIARIDYTKKENCRKIVQSN